MKDGVMSYCRKAGFGQIFRSFSSNSGAIFLLNRNKMRNILLSLHKVNPGTFASRLFFACLLWGRLVRGWLLSRRISCDVVDTVHVVIGCR